MADRNAGQARAVVVGAGVMGRWHAHAIVRVGGAVVGIVDPSPRAAAGLVGAHRGAASFPDLDAALAATSPDVVHVCTPTASHAGLVEAALAGGSHVLVEKPLAGSSEETESLLALAHARGLVLNPVHQLPFQPGFQSLLRRRGQLGELVRVAYRTCSAGGDGRSGEERRELLLEILPHPVSLVSRVFPELDPVVLQVVRHTDDDLDLTGLLGDVRLDVSVSLRGRPTCNEILLVGTRATGFAVLFHGYALVENGRVSCVTKAWRPFRLGGLLVAHAGGNLLLRGARREPAYPGLRELVLRFHAAALGAGEPPVPAAEALAAARLIDRVRSTAGP